MPAALRSAPRQRPHRGSWALASYPSFSRRTPGPRDHGTLDGNQKDIEPSWLPRHGACFLFKTTRTSYLGRASCAELRSVTAAAPWFQGLRSLTTRVRVSE